LSYGPFGEPGTTGGASLRHTGQQLDPDSGLYYYKARAFSPECWGIEPETPSAGSYSAINGCFPHLCAQGFALIEAIAAFADAMRSRFRISRCIF
jgi:hypothetical protein